MSNPSDDNGFVKISSKNPSFFFIERNEWEKLKKDRQKRSFKGLQWKMMSFLKDGGSYTPTVPMLLKGIT